MSVVTVDTFNAYINQYENDDTGLKQIFLDSAEQMIIDHIGYDFNAKDYIEYLEGLGTNSLQLSAFPINEITEVSIDGVVMTPSEADFLTDRERIIYVDEVFTNNASVIVKHNSGNAVVPGIISLVELQVAGLLFSESSGNIGVTSKSFDGGNSRTFMKTTNFEPYLTKLDSLKVVKWI